MNSCMERYRSGHNEAVLKTVCPKGRVGSNPTLSVLTRSSCELNRKYIQANVEKYPSRLKGLPWKGSRSLIAARGFKSLLLRLLNIYSTGFRIAPEKFQKMLDKSERLK